MFKFYYSDTGYMIKPHKRPCMYADNATCTEQIKRLQSQLKVATTNFR